MNSILGQDPGGKRMGWAIIANPHTHYAPVYIASGLFGLDRKGEGKNIEAYQEYKLRLVEHFSIKVDGILYKYRPVAMVNEVQPAVGGGSYIAATQAELAKTSMVVFQSAFYRDGLTVTQYGSNTIKKTLTGDQKASKVKVRDAVIEIFPELAHRKSAWQVSNEGMDEPDAIATALCYWTKKEFL